MYSWEWLGYGMTVQLGGGEIFLQGEEADQLHDQLEACETDEEVADILSEYEGLFD